MGLLARLMLVTPGDKYFADAVHWVDYFFPDCFLECGVSLIPPRCWV